LVFSGLFAFDGRLFQVLSNCGELFEGGFQISSDFRSGEVGGFFEGVVFEPEDVQIDFIPLSQLFIRDT